MRWFVENKVRRAYNIFLWIKSKTKIEKRSRRRLRTRAKISGTADRPRLTVFKSNKYIYAQIIDDEKKQTIASASSIKMGANDLVKRLSWWEVSWLK